MKGLRRLGRRRLAAGLAGMIAAARPTRAQPAPRRVGALLGLAEGDPESVRRVAALRDGLARLGWVEGRTLVLDVAYSGDPAQIPALAAALVARRPDVLFGGTTPVLRALQQRAGAIPIVFAGVSDPIGDGFVAGLTQPGGAITGFLSFDSPIAGKWLELLREAGPGVRRAAVLSNPDTSPDRLFMPTFAQAGPRLGFDVVAAPVRSADEIDSAIAAAGRDGAAGLVVLPDVFVTRFRDQIVALAARHRVPAVYNQGFWARSGGLVAYGPDFVDLYARAPEYIDRILRGASPAALPVQAPSRFELVVNSAAARALGLALPPALLTRADEVIE